MASTSAIDNSVEFSVWVPIYLPWSTGADTEERREVLRLSEALDKFDLCHLIIIHARPINIQRGSS